MSYPDNDEHWEEGIVESVEPGAFTSREGWSLGVRPEGAQPQVGGTYRTYGRGVGYPVRGLYFDGECNHYETEGEHEAAQRRDAANREYRDRKAWRESGRTEFDAQYAKLPEVFRRRLDRFMKNHPDFGWKFGAYEMTSCVDAVLIADTLKTVEAVHQFAKAPWDEQQKIVPGLNDGHSGNTFGMAVRLAYEYLADPDMVWREHAAIAPHVGCEEAGCLPVNDEGAP